MIKLFIIHLLLAFTLPVFTQDCPSGTGQIYFETQAEVNQFIIDFPNCNRLEMQLLINDDSGEEITDLSPFNNLESVRGLSLRSIGDPLIGGFSKLTEINGSLDVFQTELTNLDFLSNLTLIYALENVTVRIDQNALLEDISGLINVEPDSIYTISLMDNPLLSVCNYSFVCEMLSRPPPPIGNHRVKFNAIGCEDIDAIIEQCDDPIEPDEPEVEDPTLCPIASRPGMQIDRVDDNTYNIMYHYGIKRMYLEEVAYTELLGLIAYHKVEKDLLFDFDKFALKQYCERAEIISKGDVYQLNLPSDPMMEYKIEVTLSEIDFFQNFVLTVKSGESVKL